VWIAVFCALLGGIRYDLALPHFDQNSLSTYNNSGRVTLEGVIDSDPDVRDTYINLRVSADQLTLPDGSARPIEGSVLVRPGRPADFQYGDRVRVSGELLAPPEFATFSYKDYLARQGIYAMIDRPQMTLIAPDQGSPILATIYAFKDRARDVINHILPEPEASLLDGILLGDDAGLPADVQAEFRLTGTTHIIAISGYNITILVSILSALTIRLVGRRRSFPILVLGLIAYTIMVGASASVVRASLMGILTLVAIYFGRQSLAISSLFGAGLIMTLLTPDTLFDVGFQLSFAATLGLIVYAKPFADATERWLAQLFSNVIARRVLDVINDALLVTLAAQVATLPLLIVYFRQLSLVSLIVNPLVLPAQTGVMVFGLLSLAVGLIALPLGQIVAWSAWLFLAWTISVIHIFAGLPNAAIPLGYVDPIWPLLYYALLIGLTWYLRQPIERRPRLVGSLLDRRRLIFIGGMCLVLIGVVLSWQPDGQLHLYALSVDGHPVLIRTPAGRKVLIGGSNSPSALLSALGEQLPFWDREIDLLIVPQADTLQLNGLEAVIDRYHVHQIFAAEIPTSNKAGRDWQAALSDHQLQALPLADYASSNPDLDVALSIDNSNVLVSAGDVVIGLGPSEQAQIDLIGEPIDPLPPNAQLILQQTAEAASSDDPRLIAVADNVTIDLSLGPGGLTIGTLR
jgi:competence protein ComEC